jgi:hypothetical protein
VRRLLFISLVALLAVPAAGATIAPRTSGSIYLQFREGAGVAKVRYKGNFFGRIARGRIVTTRNVTVSGYSTRRVLPSGLIEYRGPNSQSTFMGFRTPQPPARWRLRLFGRGIYASGFVGGCMTLDGVDSGPTGLFRRGQDSVFHAWPRTATAYRLGVGC